MNEKDELIALLELHHCQEAGEQEALWRRGMASLAALGRHRPVPLEGLDPMALQASAELALERGWVDELSWLNSSSQALLDLMHSLPRGNAKRELGRKILNSLYSGNAHEFCSLASSLAKSSPKVLADPEVQARIALCLQLPVGKLPQIDQLSLSLLTCPQTQDEWLNQASHGNLIDRSLAAKIVEGAARESFRRYCAGDFSGVEVLESKAVQESWNLLLHDREPLAWRHAAAAQAMLLPLRPVLREQLRHQLKGADDIGAWRRSLCTLAASIAVDGEDALRLCLTLIEKHAGEEKSDLGAMLLGATSAAIFETQYVDSLLSALIPHLSLNNLRDFYEVLRQDFAPDFGSEALALVRAALQRQAADTLTFESSQAQCLLDELKDLEAEDSPSLAGTLRRASQHFLQNGSKNLRALVQSVSDTLHQQSEHIREHSAGPGRSSKELSGVGQLDHHLFQRSYLSNMLKITSMENTAKLEEKRALLHNYLLSQALLPPSADLKTQSEDTAWQRSFLQSLIRLIDAESMDTAPSEALRARRSEVVRRCTQYLQMHSHRSAQRMLVVCIARACDAGLREAWYELSDLLLALFPALPGEEELAIYSQASLQPELRAMIVSYQKFNQCREINSSLDALRQLIGHLSLTGSPRSEALRSCLQEFLRTVNLCLSKPGGVEDSHWVALADVLQWLAQLSSGARRRMDLAHQSNPPFLGKAIRGLSSSTGDAKDGTFAVLEEEIPSCFHYLAKESLSHLIDKGPSRSLAQPETLRTHRNSIARFGGERLADYRILGKLGDGGAASVVLACKESERKAANPRLFAIKRPRYSGQHSQVLSEEEFMELFRSEASTLLTLPKHPNLASFVNFDLAAKPDPILVMEYVEGPHIGRLLESHHFQSSEVFSLLDGIAAGLQSMHAQGIGHLDIKPENIIVRDNIPVLVDFGLAGQQYRPGCASLHYGAPELFATERRGPAPPVDLYSLACISYELFCRQPLFRGDSLQELLRAHLGHDGMPEPLVSLSKSNPSLLPFTKLLGQALRHEAKARISISVFRDKLAALRSSLQDTPWPWLRKA